MDFGAQTTGSLHLIDPLLPNEPEMENCASPPELPSLNALDPSFDLPDAQSLAVKKLKQELARVKDEEAKIRNTLVDENKSLASDLQRSEARNDQMSVTLARLEDSQGHCQAELLDSLVAKVTAAVGKKLDHMSDKLVTNIVSGLQPTLCKLADKNSPDKLNAISSSITAIQGAIQDIPISMNEISGCIGQFVGDTSSFNSQMKADSKEATESLNMIGEIVSNLGDKIKELDEDIKVLKGTVQLASESWNFEKVNSRNPVINLEPETSYIQSPEKVIPLWRQKYSERHSTTTGKKVENATGGRENRSRQHFPDESPESTRVGFSQDDRRRNIFCERCGFSNHVSSNCRHLTECKACGLCKSRGLGELAVGHSAMVHRETNRNRRLKIFDVLPPKCFRDSIPTG